MQQYLMNSIFDSFLFKKIYFMVQYIKFEQNEENGSAKDGEFKKIIKT